MCCSIPHNVAVHTTALLLILLAINWVKKCSHHERAPATHKRSLLTTIPPTLQEFRTGKGSSHTSEFLKTRSPPPPSVSFRATKAGTIGRASGCQRRLQAGNNARRWIFTQFSPLPAISPMINPVSRLGANETGARGCQIVKYNVDFLHLGHTGRSTDISALFDNSAGAPLT